MSEHVEKQFEDIWEQAVNAARDVKCDVNEYICGLEDGKLLMQEEINAACEQSGE